MIARYLKYGNHCLLYQTVVLDGNIIIIINREEGGWYDKKPRVSTQIYDTRLEAKDELYCYKMVSETDEKIYFEYIG